MAGGLYKCWSGVLTMFTGKDSAGCVFLLGGIAELRSAKRSTADRFVTSRVMAVMRRTPECRQKKLKEATNKLGEKSIHIMLFFTPLMITLRLG